MQFLSNVTYDDAKNRMPSMYIREIQMEGFKCYQHRTVIRDIGPGFNAITGMNGSGKSNVIDAILFCMGFDTPRLLRIQSLKDLINTNSSRCTVTIVFQNDGVFPQEHKAMSEMSLTRTYDGKSKYKINNTTCTLATITKLLDSVHLGSSAYFTVLQGHITKVLSMRRDDLNSLIEETAGIRTYETNKSRALEHLDRKEAKLKEAKSNLSARISPFVHKLRERRERYKSAVSALEAQGRCRAREREIRAALMQCSLFSLQQRLLAGVSRYMEDKKALAETEKILEEARKSEDASIFGLRIKLENAMRKAESMGVEEIEREIAAKESEIRSIVLRPCEYEDLKQKETALLDELTACTKNGISRFESVAERRNELARVRSECRVLEESLYGRKCNVEDVQKRIDAIEMLFPTGLDDMKAKLDEYKRGLHYPLVKGVLGSVEENFTVREKRYEEAVMAILGSRGKFVIVENDDVAAHILADHDRKISIIPLNKITSSGKAPSEDELDGKGVRMLDTIDFCEDVRGAMEFIFGPFCIVESETTARELAFRNKVVCVLLDGTIYDPKGTLSAGKVRVERFRGMNVRDASARITQLEKNKVIYDSRQGELRDLKEMLGVLKRVDMLRARERGLVYAIRVAEGECSLRDELKSLRERLLAEHGVHKQNAQKQEQIRALTRELEKLTAILSKELENRDRIVKYIQELEMCLREKEARQGVLRPGEVDDRILEEKRKQLVKSMMGSRGEVGRLNKDFSEKYQSYMDLLGNLNTKAEACEVVHLECSEELNIHRGVSERFSNAGNKDELARELELVMAELRSLAGIKIEKTDPKSFELLEKNESMVRSLEEKISRLEADRMKIQHSMDRLSALSVKEKNKALEYLNKSIGKFLRYFIKDADAMISTDYEIKVKIGSWKENLEELSGGQRSLVALSLIFAMLAYNPAPFYVFDEIDSALDVKYTQNIGEIIRREFKSQFILVSLKSEMIDNAEHVFRVLLEDSRPQIKQVR